MDPISVNLSYSPMSHEQFMRLFLSAERELLRYVMALVPNVNDARDVVQETAVALWKANAKYDRAKPFDPWACRFALNEARLFLRTEGRRRRFLSEEVAGILKHRRLEIVGRLDERRDSLRDCVERLPSDQHAQVRGYYFDDESIDTLSARYERGSEAIYKSLQRIR